MEKLTRQDLLNIALEIEKNGMAFYEKAAGLASRPALKDLFLNLAAMEAEHQKVFENAISYVKKEVKPETYTGEYHDYIRDLAGAYVFSAADHAKQEDLVKELSRTNQVIDYAIRFEKDSILFFQEILYLFREEDQGFIWNVIDQEKRHVMQLLGQKEL